MAKDQFLLLSESLNLSQSVRDLSEAHSAANTSLSRSAVVASAAFSLVDQVGMVANELVQLCLSNNACLGAQKSKQRPFC